MSIRASHKRSVLKSLFFTDYVPLDMRHAMSSTVSAMEIRGILRTSRCASLRVYFRETVVTRMWKEAEGRIVFETRVKERDEVVLSNAAIELYDEIPKKAPKAAPVEDTAAPEVPTTPISADIFEGLSRYVSANGAITDKIGKVFQFKLTDPKSVWTLDLKGGAVNSGETVKPDCTLELSDADFMAMCMGEADPQQLYFGGQLQISGDIMASQKLNFLQKVDRQYFMDAMAARGGTGGGVAESAVPDEPGSADAFLGIHAHIGDHPELAEKIQTIFAFKLSEPDSAWTLDLKNGGLSSLALLVKWTVPLSFQMPISWTWSRASLIHNNCILAANSRFPATSWPLRN